MIDTPFLGDKYNYILPGTILVFSLVFVIINICKYEAKIVNMLRKYTKESTNSENDSAT